MPPILTILISLKRSETRRARCIINLQNSQLNWEILDAIDGLKLQSTPPEYHEEKVIRLLGFPLSASEIGCFLSHRLAWARSIEKNQPTLILEDDFSFEPHFERALTTLTKTYHDWDIVRLQGLNKMEDSTLMDMGSFRVVKNHGDPLGATGYIIKPSAAMRLIQCSQDIYEPLDHFIEHHQKHGLKIIAIKPYPIIINGVSSTIHDRPERKPIKGLRKWMRSIFRKLDRLMNPNPWFPK